MKHLEPLNSFFAAAVFAAALPALARADVHVVDPGQPGAFATPQAAISAAVDGDTVLVKSGSYAGFTIDGKALGVVVDDGHVATVSGTVVVRNLVPGQEVRIAGFQVMGDSSGIVSGNCFGSQELPGPGLLVENALAAVRFQDCSFQGAIGSSDCGGGLFTELDDSYDGARVLDSDNVAFVRCTLKGGEGRTMSPTAALFVAGSGGRGVFAQDSLIAFHDCTLLGGHGGDATHGGAGGTAYLVRGLGGLVSGCTLIGGDGGFGEDFLPTNPKPGGDAIRAELGANPADGAQVQHLDSLLQGGLGGSEFISNDTGPDGEPFAGPGLEVAFDGLADHLAAPRTVRENATLSLVIQGTPGRQAVLIRSRYARFRPFAPARGVQLVGQNPGAARVEARWLLLGAIPASGSLQVDFPVADMGPGFGAGLSRWQALTFDPASPLTTGAFGDFAEVTVLDDTY